MRLPRQIIERTNHIFINIYIYIYIYISVIYLLYKVTEDITADVHIYQQLLYLGAFLGKFVCIQFTILSYSGSIPVPYGDWEGRRFEESVSWLRVYLTAVGAKK